jgi:hypothetical protein
MKNFVKVGLKSGAVLDIEADYKEFVERALRSSEVFFESDLMTFRFSDIESIQPATREEGNETITKSILDTNITRMESEIAKFKKFRDNMTTDEVLVSELVNTISQSDFSELAKETVETGAPEETETTE